MIQVLATNHAMIIHFVDIYQLLKGKTKVAQKLKLGRESL